MNDPHGSDFSSTSPDDPTINEHASRLEPKMGGSGAAMKDPQGSPKPPPTGAASKPGAHYCTSDDDVLAKCEAYNMKRVDARLEIAPGITERLRGSKETMECVERDFYLPCTCFSCEAHLCCIMDAKYVLCPRCRVVSPLKECPKGFDGGVGLGFTFETLQQMQYEITLRRRQSRGFR